METNKSNRATPTKQHKSQPYKKPKKLEIKRTIALNALAIILMFVYACLISLSVLFSWSLHQVWFSFFLTCASVYLIVRGLFFNLDSNYLLGFITLSFGAFGAFNFFYELYFADVIYFVLLALSFLAVYLIFRQNIYIISFALSSLEVLLLVINKFLLNIFTFILLQAMLVALAFVVFLSVTRIKKEKESAISNKQKRV